VIRKNKSSIEKFRVAPQVKISLLWAALLAFYIYNDYILLWVPGQIEGMIAGGFGPFGEVTDWKLLIVAAFLAVPISMIFLSAILPSNASRWLNLIVAPLHGIPNALTLLPMFAAPLFFQFIVVIELIVMILIIWIAARWPKQDAEQDARQDD